MSQASNIFLFTGESTYQIQQHLKLRKEKFIQKYGAQSIFSFNQYHKDALGKIQDALLGGSLFATKKLVIFYGLPPDTLNKNPGSTKQIEEFLLQQLPQTSPNDIVVFVSYKPDKRSKLFKYLSSIATIKTFKKLTNNQLIDYLDQNLPQLPYQIKQKLVQMLGEDEHRFFMEIQKLNYLNQNLSTLTAKDLEKIFTSAISFNIFKWLDQIRAAPPQRKKQLLKQINIEEDPL